MGHGHDHEHHHGTSAEADRRWLSVAFTVIVVFMVGELVAGLLAHSLALVADSAHMLTDAAALALAVFASLLAQRPARGAYTFGFTRVDALAGQANGVTLLVFAAWVAFEAVRRLVNPPAVHGGLVVVVAAIGVAVNVFAVALVGRANKASLNIRGAWAHLITDLYAFIATLAAGLVVLTTDWLRADAVASLVVAALMIWTGLDLVRASGRVFLEAAPHGLKPDEIGASMASVLGVDAIHDLHVWDLGAGEPALSAHVVVGGGFDCHDVASLVRSVLVERFDITHATLQADHTHSPGDPIRDDCHDAHGPEYSAATAVERPVGAAGVESVD